MRKLLADKYGEDRIPGTRRIAADIALANNGDTISHARVHDIMTGTADNLSDRTKRLLARFFGLSPADFLPPESPVGPDDDSVQALAARFAAFTMAQITALREAIEMAERMADRKRDE